jgi:hypothetical protein
LPDYLKQSKRKQPGKQLNQDQTQAIAKAFGISSLATNPYQSEKI